MCINPIYFLIQGRVAKLPPPPYIRLNCIINKFNDNSVNGGLQYYKTNFL